MWIKITAEKRKKIMNPREKIITRVKALMKKGESFHLTQGINDHKQENTILIG